MNLLKYTVKMFTYDIDSRIFIILFFFLMVYINFHGLSGVFIIDNILLGCMFGLVSFNTGTMLNIILSRMSDKELEELLD
jgi:uncharacterized membrane protein (DUF485 family)